MIEAVDIYRQQGGLSGLSISVEAGTVTAVLGPNGAGKSTLLDVLAGRSRVDTGMIRLDGRPIETWSPRDLAIRRAFLPQIAEVAFPIPVRELVALGRSPYRAVREARFDALAIETALRLSDAWHLRDRIYQRLSGGERQRVQLARVVAQIWRPQEQNGAPRMLLLDEPTASLDPGHRLAVMQLLRDLAASGIGVLIALHDLNDALHFADHVVLLKQGCRHSAGKPEVVLTAQALTTVYDAPVEIVQMANGRSIVVFG
jgi:iron complex transport system ATP-binding protein